MAKKVIHLPESPTGYIDTRNGEWYRDVWCKESDAQYFVEA